MKLLNSKFDIKNSTLSLLLVFFSFLTAASAEDNAVFKGRVLDAEGKAVKGAIVLLYDGPDVRRRADFESARTATDGRFRMVLFPGRYWAVARVKKAAEYGPLMPGDKHSGEPAELELIAGREHERDFSVVDIKASAGIKKTREDYMKIKGKIVDEKGRPAGNAYAVASRNGPPSGLPDFMSAWTDESGNYTLYLPKGRFYIGAAAAFPPGKGFVDKEIVVVSDKSGVDIIIK